MADTDKLRIAIVNADKCKPNKCRQECKKSCPVVRLGKLCIEVTRKDSVAFISEELCIGCGICPKKCPFEAIAIINLPKALSTLTTHRYGPNAFKLHRLPQPRPGQVLGLVGANGTGKSTALKILSGKLKPNLGRFDAPPDWDDILLHFRGSELQNYFTKILEDNIKATIKPQYVDHIPKAVKGTVGAVMRRKDERDKCDEIAAALELSHLMERQVAQMSGGELQRFAIAVLCLQDCDVYMFDEPSSYLDVKQRLRAALAIRAMAERDDRYVLCVEHDLAVLDYLSDFICVLYGRPGAYGVVTAPYGVREGINVFLAGFVPTENLRFRDVSLTFKVSEQADDRGGDDGGGGGGGGGGGAAGGDKKGKGKDKDKDKEKERERDERRAKKKAAKDKGKDKERGGGGGGGGGDDDDGSGGDDGGAPRRVARAGMFTYPSLTKTLGNFTLRVDPGDFNDSEILVLLGQNGTGKTTFIRLLAGSLKPDDESIHVPELRVSHKPQTIAPKFPGPVQALLLRRIKDAFTHPQFATDVLKPLEVERLYDQDVRHLSGGEAQRVALALCLGMPANVYLVDEPSAYLDSEQRIIAAKVIKRYIMHAQKTGFIVEHDFIMATYLADRVIVYDGEPGVDCTAHAPQSLLSGMNQFLKLLNITFRRDPTNYRPRINKLDSVKDTEQKLKGNYFFLDADD